MKGKVVEVVEQLLVPILEREQLELVDIEYKKEGKHRFLRIFVDKAGGVDITDCERVSEQLSKRLDEEDPIQDPYFLEVSSPGAERPLKRERDFEWAVGKNVRVTTYVPVDGENVFEGKLLQFDGRDLVIDTGRRQVVLSRDQVAKARLAIVF